MTSSIPPTMRAFAIDNFGDLGSLRELPVPELGPGDILVRVHAAGVNPIDLKIRDGQKPVNVSLPHVLGQDAAGMVVRVGEAVSEFKEGDDVYGAFWLAGTFAEYVKVTVSKSAVSLKPATLDFERAAAVPTAGLAAVAAMKAVDVQIGETLLVVGATGGVGSYVIQLAARRGAIVLVTARPETEAYARSLGASEVFDHLRGDVVASVKNAYPDGIDAVVDVVSGRDALEHIATVLRPGGRLATTVHSADESAMARRGGIRATNLDVFGAAGHLDVLNSAIQESALLVPVERRYALSDTAEALAIIAGGHTRGKLVLTINP